MSRKSNATAVTIGIDPGKNTLHLIGLDARGAIVLREKVARDRIVVRLANVPPPIDPNGLSRSTARPFRITSSSPSQFVGMR